MRIILIYSLLLGFVLGATAQQKANYKLAEKFNKRAMTGVSEMIIAINQEFIHKSDIFCYSFTTL